MAEEDVTVTQPGADLDRSRGDVGDVHRLRVPSEQLGKPTTAFNNRETGH
jgi:hypothetical protein